MITINMQYFGGKGSSSSKSGGAGGAQERSEYYIPNVDEAYGDEQFRASLEDMAHKTSNNIYKGSNQIQEQLDTASPGTVLEVDAYEHPTAGQLKHVYIKQPDGSWEDNWVAYKNGKTTVYDSTKRKSGTIADDIWNAYNGAYN